jgi:hypothetical protein
MSWIRGYRWPFGQSFYTSTFALAYAWINTRRKVGFGFVQGFPFVYLGLQDADPFLYFSGTSLALNVIVGAIAGVLIWRSAPAHKVRCTWQESSILALVAATFTWSNWEAWYGWRPTVWGMTVHSTTASYGTPFIYMTNPQDGAPGFYPLWLGLNVLIFCAALIAISALFHHSADISSD